MISRTTFLSFAAAVLVSEIHAQQTVPVYRAVTPKYAGSYSMASGTLDRIAAARFGPDVIFNNSTLTNYYSVPGLNQEWVDEGMLCDRSQWSQESMNGFEFVYCSTEADPGQNGGTISFYWYDETIVGQGPANGGSAAGGGFICGYDIIGLPLGAANGSIQCWIVTVSLLGGFACPGSLTTLWTTDEAGGKLFGWSFVPRNDNTGPWITAGGKGSHNSFIWIDQTGTLVGVFWFGGTPFASFAMKMKGDEAGVICYCGAAAGNTLHAQVSSMTNGGTLTVTYDTSGGGNYSLLANESPAFINVGNCTICVDIIGLSPNGIPVPLSGSGSDSLALPAMLPPECYLQVICHNGSPLVNSGQITACSPGYCVCTNP